MVIFCMVFLFICTSLIVTSRQVEIAGQQYVFARNLEKGAYELNQISNDYLLNHQYSQKIQWDSRFTSFSNDLSQMSPDTPEKLALITNIRTDQQQLRSIIQEVTGTYEGYNNSPELFSPGEFTQLAMSRMALQNQEMISNASLLSEMIHENVRQVQNTNSFLTFFMLIILLGVLLSNMYMINRRVRGSIERLQNGARIIGSGNLDHRIEEKLRDEFGDLASVFNLMAENLKLITASRSELEHEIEERNKAEVAARESLELYQTLAESAEDLFFICDPDGTIRYINRNGAAMYGLTPDDFIGKSLEERFPPDVAKRQRQLICQVLEEKGKLFVEFEMSMQGDNRWIDVQLIPIFTEDKGIKSIMGVVRDITARKLIENVLRETKDYLENLIQYANAPIITWTSDFRITEFNHAFESLTGMARDEVIGQSLPILFPDDSRETSMNLIRQTLTGEQWEVVEIPIRHVSGPVRTVLWNSAKITDTDGKIIAIIAQGQDITKQKQAEEALRNIIDNLEVIVSERTRELKEAQIQLVEKEKLVILGKLAGGVGHELRNPLGTIKNAAYFLGMALENPGPEVKEMIELIDQEVSRSEDIISSLLDFARQKSLIFRKVEIEKVVHEALRRNPVPDTIRVIILPEKNQPKILADSDKLLQVFNNFISNAFQAMQDGGTLTIMSAHPSSDWMSISFTDTGSGISAEHMNRLFEPLFTTKTRGIGLGMVVSRTIIEAHGGSVDVRSEEGKGTVVTVNLPVSGKREE